MKLGKSFQTALRLPCLGGLVAEAVDKRLHVVALFFLLLFHLEGQRLFLPALALKVIVIAHIDRELALIQMQNGIDRLVQQITVMAHQQNGVGIVPDVALEPDRAFKVEVVGGLVEQQNVGCAKQRRCQRHPHAPATGQGGAGAVLRRLAEAEARQDDGRPRRSRMGLDIGQSDLDFRNAVRIGCRFSLGQQGFPFLVARHHRVEQAFRPAGRFLRHRADPGILRHAGGARFRDQVAKDKLQKC